MRKLFALLLAMMMLAMPLTAFAEREETLFGGAFNYHQTALDAGRRIHLTATYGELMEELANDPDVGSMMTALFNALTIEEDMQGDEAAMSIGFKKADGSVASVLSFGGLTDGADTYIKSNLLGADAVVVGADELTVVIGRLIGVLVEMGAIEAEEAMSMISELPAMIDMINAQMVPADIDFASLNYTSLVNAFLPFLMKAEQVEMTVLPKNCDIAAAEYVLNMTQDDAKKIVIGVMTFIKDNPDLMKLLETVMASSQPMYLYEDEEMPTVEQQIDELIAELEAAEDSGNSIRIRYWTDELGGVVYANIVPVDEDGDALEESPLTYSRLTLNDKVAHTVSFVDGYQTGTMEAVIGANSLRLRISGDEDGEPIMSMLLDINASVAENNIKTAVFFELSVYDAGDDMIIRIDYEDDTELNGVDFVSDIKASVSINGMKIMTIFADMYSADPLPSIKDGNAIRLATLTDAEFANWFAGVMNTVQSWPVTLLMSMPPEVLQMMMQNGM